MRRLTGDEGERKRFARGLFASLLLLFLLLAIPLGFHLLSVDRRLETLETLRPGFPVRELLARGYRPYAQGETTYEGRRARWYRFRSSGAFGGVRSLDFGIVANEHRIIVAVVSLGTDEGRDEWRALTGDGT